MKTSDIWDVKAKGDKLVISFSIDTMLRGSPSMDCMEVTDKKVFVKELINDLLSEEEDGTTPIHRMMDEVIARTIDNGAEGIDETDEY